MTKKRYTLFTLLSINLGLYLLFASQNTIAAACTADTCHAPIKQMSAYTDGQVRIKLEGGMSLGNLTCDALTLNNTSLNNAAYEHMASLLLLAQASKKSITIGMHPSTCDIRFITIDS